MNYGVPYKGSKNKIAKWVVDNLPPATNFYDLFAGGCAVTHCAMLSEKYQNYYANDIWTAPKLFLDAINGKYANETRWISREEFFEKRLNDPYIQFCWSFGNNGRNYMYSKEIETWKKALHYAQVFKDFSLLEEFGIKSDGSRKDIKENHLEYKRKYIEWYAKNVWKSDIETEKLRQNLTEKIKDGSEKLRQYLIDGLKKAGKRPRDVDSFLGTNGMASHYFGRSQWEFPTREVYGLQDLMQSLESLESLERLESLQRLQSLQISQGSYENVVIKPNSVIYCDIPYKNTSSYNFNSNKKSDKNDFDYEAFYNWCKKQKELVIISEYSMPDDFICVNQIEKTVSLSGGASNKATEKLFVPKHQIELYNNLMKIKNHKDADFVQLEFDFMSA